MTKRYCIFITALFCAFLGLFLAANALSPDRDFSQLENRALQQLPAPSVKTLVSGAFMSDFETYVNDQFVLRDGWIALKSATELALGKQENNGVYFGKQGTLITHFQAPDAGKVTNNLSYVNKFVENVDIPVYFSLIPTQACIWADRLPEGAPNASQTDLLTQAQAATQANWYDTYPSLWAHRDEDIFYTYDKNGNPVEEPRQLYDKSFLAVKDKYAMFLGGQQSLGVIRTGREGPKLLLIRDSYTDSLAPFLTAHYSEIHLIDLRYYKLSVADYIKQNGIDAAVVLYSVPNFVTDSNLVWLGR